MANHQQLFSLQKTVGHHLHTGFYYSNGKTITRSNLFEHALQLSRLLPENKFAINLCENRYLFTVSFLAALIKKQVNLLPPNQAPRTVDKLLKQYQQSYCITDKPHSNRDNYFLLKNEFSTPADNKLPAIDINRTAAISFTSGSTGNPKAVSKTWRELQSSALLAIQRFKLNSQPLNLVSTVPAQHTYGLETSFFWPLFSASLISSRRPFFPEDIRQATTQSSSPCLLITTPTHIKACARAGLTWKNIHMVLSATAPLPPDLAEQAEESFKAPVFEIFGSTETLSFASRRQTVCEKWEPYQGIRLTPGKSGYSVSGGHLLTPISVDDQFDIDPSGRFILTGRSSELIKVAGKRTSLTELNRVINNITGVDDAMFFETGTGRLGALVAGNLPKSEILQALKQSIDEVFLPRPLYLVERIPRNEVGKIIKTKLDHLIKEQTEDYLT